MSLNSKSIVLFLISTSLNLGAHAQVTKPVLTPDPANRTVERVADRGVASSDGPWTCMTTCGGTNAKAEKRKIKEALQHSDKNCGSKGKDIAEAMEHLKTRLERDGDQATEHAPNYECDGCIKTDIVNTVCRNQKNQAVNYKDWAKTKSLPETQKTSP